MVPAALRLHMAVALLVGAARAAVTPGAVAAADCNGLFQESVHIIARGVEQARPTVVAAPRMGIQGWPCSGQAPLEEEVADAADSAGADSSVEDVKGDQICFLQRFVKPHRLRAVGIAVIGFGLLRLDVASAMLLAL
mmetsp:Transcript_61041/g.196671  ORF Transcript_61041/g.196671 Transcript_61041/m.196671 type:complete len:137 (-) Transcript_61041:59-469(-)